MRDLYYDITLCLADILFIKYLSYAGSIFKASSAKGGGTFGRYSVFQPKKIYKRYSKVDDTRFIVTTFRAGSNENIFERVRTNLRVQFGPFWVQKGPFMVLLPKKVEILQEKSSQVDDTRSVEPTS